MNKLCSTDMQMRLRIDVYLMSNLRHHAFDRRVNVHVQLKHVIRNAFQFDESFTIKTFNALNLVLFGVIFFFFVWFKYYEGIICKLKK